MSESLLSVRALRHVFPDGVTGLEDINLDIRAGQFVLVAGENGAGKTLLMRHLVGLAWPSAGQVLYRGQPIASQLAEVRRRLGLVFQDSGAQIVGLTLGEEVAFGPKNLGWKPEAVRQAVQAALETVGLSGREHEYCGHLSGGEKRRLAIAGILVMEPEILVLDEPFTGLDWPAVVHLLETLTRLHRQGRTIVLLTHELDKCLAHAQHVVLMKQHRILTQGTPAEVWNQIPEAAVYRPRGTLADLENMTWLNG